MPLLGYQKRFAGQVESGEKRHTIRAKRKDGKDPKPGDRLYQYVGLQTKGCRKLREDICTASIPILIDRSEVILGGELLSYSAALELAYADGFDNLDDFREYFLDGGKDQFEGRLIKW